METQFPSIGTVLCITFTSFFNTLLFVIMFFVFRRLCRTVINLVCRAIIKKSSGYPGYAKEKEAWYEKYDKVISGIIGGLSSFLICMLTISPLMGTAETVVKVADVAEASSPGILSKYAIGDERISNLIDWTNGDDVTCKIQFVTPARSSSADVGEYMIECPDDIIIQIFDSEGNDITEDF